MTEIAASMAAAGLPDGFHQAAADIFRRTGPGAADGTEQMLQPILDALSRQPGQGGRGQPAVVVVADLPAGRDQLDPGQVLHPVAVGQPAAGIGDDGITQRAPPLLASTRARSAGLASVGVSSTATTVGQPWRSASR